MTLIDRFLSEHPFFCALLEHERRILSHYIELYRCDKGSYLVLPNELQEVLWIVVRGQLAEYKTYKTETVAATLSTENQKIEYQETENAGEPAIAKQLLRYFYPGDLINIHALTQEFVAPNEIVSLEDNTQVICMTTFHLAKLAQQQPRIHKALRPVYDPDGFLISGLPKPVWQQMNEIPPPHTRDLGKQWLQLKPLLRSHNSWANTIIAALMFSAANIWQMHKLHVQTIPFFNIALIIISLLIFIFIALQRYRNEYTLKRSLLHITERGILGLSSKIKSYPLLSISQVDLLPIPILPILTRLFHVGGLRIHTYHKEIIQIFSIDHVYKWQEILTNSLNEARQLQEQIHQSQTVKQFQKWHKLQPELIKEINYRNAELEGKLQCSLRALLLQTGPIVALVLTGLYYSFQSELIKIYLTVPLYSLVVILVFQILRWLRYTWRISEEFLFRHDNFLGGRHNHKIPIKDIQDVHLEYLHILGFGNISFRVNNQIIRLQNLKSPQNILDEIESLRYNHKDFDSSNFLTHQQLEMYHDFSRNHSHK